MLIDTRPSALADLSADARLYLEAQNASLTTYNIELGYDYWTAGSFGNTTAGVSHLGCKSQMKFCMRSFRRNSWTVLPLDFRLRGIWVDISLTLWSVVGLDCSVM